MPAFLIPRGHERLAVGPFYSLPRSDDPLKNGTCRLIFTGRPKCLLWTAGLARFAFGQNLFSVLIKRPGLWHGLDGLFKLRVVLQFALVPIIQAKVRGKHFALDLPFQPSKVGLNILIGILDFLLVEILAKVLDHRVGYGEILGHVGLLSEIESREVSHTLLLRVENSPAVE